LQNATKKLKHQVFSILGRMQENKQEEKFRKFEEAEVKKTCSNKN